VREASDAVVHEDDEPTMEKVRHVAAESAFAAPPPPPIVKGTPIEPPQPKPPPAVDEALSVLAFLQSQSGERPRTDTPSLKEIAKEAARDDTKVTRPEVEAAIPRADKRTVIAFAAGALAGVLVTVTLQAIFSDPDPEVEEETEAELVLEAVDPVAQEEEAEEEPIAAAPPRVEQPAPPPAPRLGTLDILYPRGARARIDGKLMQSRVPIRGIRLSSGPHSVKVWKGKYRREIRFEAKGGERYVLTQKLIKR
jgi:hypothetical protein